MNQRLARRVLSLLILMVLAMSLVAPSGLAQEASPSPSPSDDGQAAPSPSPSPSASPTPKESPASSPPPAQSSAAEAEVSASESDGTQSEPSESAGDEAATPSLTTSPPSTFAGDLVLEGSFDFPSYPTSAGNATLAGTIGGSLSGTTEGNLWNVNLAAVPVSGAFDYSNGCVAGEPPLTQSMSGTLDFDKSAGGTTLGTYDGHNIGSLTGWVALEWQSVAGASMITVSDFSLVINGDAIADAALGAGSGSFIPILSAANSCPQGGQATAIAEANITLASPGSCVSDPGGCDIPVPDACDIDPDCDPTPNLILVTGPGTVASKILVAPPTSVDDGTPVIAIAGPNECFLTGATHDQATPQHKVQRQGNLDQGEFFPRNDLATWRTGAQTAANAPSPSNPASTVGTVQGRTRTLGEFWVSDRRWRNNNEQTVIPINVEFPRFHGHF